MPSGNDDQKLQLSSDDEPSCGNLPASISQPALVGYRSVGIGSFGATMRWAGMPLEKIALYMNSSQVSGSNQFQQAVQLTFKEGFFAPYRVVGKASMTAWFFQYSVMGIAFQLFDQLLSNALNVRPMYYGKELMEPAPPKSHDEPMSYKARQGIKTMLSPVLAACLESFVSNRAEAQRYFGPKSFAEIEARVSTNPILRAAGPAYGANVMRNVVMCQTSFLLTPLTYKLYFPQEKKNKASIFWYGLTLNIFVGNVVAITQQALWGRSQDYIKKHGHLSYRAVIQEGYQKEGMSAFFTVPKWFSRVLMNAPAQGTLPWFYNEVLPIGEPAFLNSFEKIVYDPFLKGNIEETIAPASLAQNSISNGGQACNLQRTRTHFATLPTANPEFSEAETPPKR